MTMLKETRKIKERETTAFPPQYNKLVVPLDCRLAQNENSSRKHFTYIYGRYMIFQIFLLFHSTSECDDDDDDDGDTITRTNDPIEKLYIKKRIKL